MINDVVDSGIGCAIGNVLINSLAYTDDFVSYCTFLDSTSVIVKHIA